MTTDTGTLRVLLARQEATEWANLARRNTTTPKALAVHAVRQLLASAQGGALPAVPQLYSAAAGSASMAVPVPLTDDETAALEALAVRLEATPEVVALAALRLVLTAGKAGASPMYKRPQIDAAPAEPRFARDTWDCATDHNFDKARQILTTLNAISKTGLTEDNRVALAELEKIQTIRPPR